MGMSRRTDSDTGVGAGRRVAVVGAGPAGFYTTAQLLDQGFRVALIDRLPTPFGLVRSGVAPDHPKIKSVTRMYEKTARKDGFRFFGGLELGSDITRAQLRERYNAVAPAPGTGAHPPLVSPAGPGAATRLGPPGGARPGSSPATTFVAWYTGHPRESRVEFD